MFKPRDQICYTAPDGEKREYGFIVSRQARHSGSDAWFCRYWLPFDDDSDKMVLRTTANAELTQGDCLEKYDYDSADEIRILCDAMGWC